VTLSWSIFTDSSKLALFAAVRCTGAAVSGGGHGRTAIPNRHIAKIMDLCSQKHYSVTELARLWNLSEKTIRRMFENEPGVLLSASQEKRLKRAYITLRIPETVMLRVHRKLRIAG
jgi:transcriptional regulator GlxA family with amidase domain